MIELSSIERFNSVLGEIRPLWVAHYEEVAMHQDSVPLDPDIGQYEFMDSRGYLSITTAREAGELVGYQFFIMKHALHYKSVMHIHSDLTYLKPKYRNGFAFIRMVKFAIDAAKQKAGGGAKRIIMNTKVSKDYGKLLSRIGFEPMDTIYVRMDK